MIAVLVFFGSRQIMQLFVSDGSEEVISLGVSYLQLIAFMYYMPSATNIIQGYFQGARRSESHADQHNSEYVREIRVRMAYDPRLHGALTAAAGRTSSAGSRCLRSNPDDRDTMEESEVILCG